MANGNKNFGGATGGIIIAVAAFALGAGASLKFAGNFAGDSASNLYANSPVIANVDGKPVYLPEAENVVKVVLGNSEKPVSYKDLDEKSRGMIVREVAAQRAMAKEAIKQGIKEDLDMKQKVSDFKNKLIIDQYLVKFITAEITKDKITARYAEIEKALKGKPQIKAEHILVGSKEDAENALNRLKTEPFAKVAKEMSIDSATKDKGGDLGYIISGTVDPEFEKAAFALKPGEISAPVKTNFGFHIIKVEEKKQATVAPFDALKQRIAQDLYNESLKSHADKLLEGSKIDLVALSEDKKETKSDESKKTEEKKEVAKEKEDKAEDNKSANDEKK